MQALRLVMVSTVSRAHERSSAAAGVPDGQGQEDLGPSPTSSAPASSAPMTTR